MTSVEQSKWGAEKASVLRKDARVDPGGLYSDIPITELTMYGQDGCSLLTKGKVTIIALSDGHGHPVGGVEFAKYGLRLLPSLVMDEVDLIIRLFKQGEKALISKLMKTIFTDMDIHLRETCSYTNTYATGGATMTINLKFPHPKQPWKFVSITSNIGDSPFVHVDPSKGIVKEHTMEWNCDSLDAWKLYAQECVDAGVVPKSAYMSRFNSGPRSHQINWMGKSALGGNLPIEVYKYKVEDGNVVAEHNTETMKELYTKASKSFKVSLQFGGSQSNRGRVKNLEAQRQGLFPSDNYGNTLEGMVQCLSSFGDRDTRTRPSVHSTLREKQNLLILPVHTHIETIHKSRVEIMGSDGLFDVMNDADLLESVSKTLPNSTDSGSGPSSGGGPSSGPSSGPETETERGLGSGGPMSQNYLTQIIDSMNRISYEIKVDYQPPMTLFNRYKGQIAWDDVSCWTQVTKVVQPPSKQKKTKRKHKK